MYYTHIHTYVTSHYIILCHIILYHMSLYDKHMINMLYNKNTNDNHINNHRSDNHVNVANGGTCQQHGRWSDRRLRATDKSGLVRYMFEKHIYIYIYIYRLYTL